MFSMTLMVAELPLAMARSGLPSLFKSPTATAVGTEPVKTLLAGRKLWADKAGVMARTTRTIAFNVITCGLDPAQNVFIFPLRLQCLSCRWGDLQGRQVEPGIVPFGSIRLTEYCGRKNVHGSAMYEPKGRCTSVIKIRPTTTFCCCGVV